MITGKAAYTAHDADKMTQLAVFCFL